MHQISTNNKELRIAYLLAILFALSFFYFILILINPPFLIFLITTLITLPFVYLFLKCYIFDWDVYIANNRIVVKNFFNHYTFEGSSRYYVKDIGVFSNFYSLFKIDFGNKKIFYFRYQRKGIKYTNPFNLLDSPTNLVNEIKFKIDEHLKSSNMPL